ncbi:MAG TPA: hypothetical protein VLC95_03770, partial [Anaerolineae bacterium]|nr:hypothetical protein [Anaerolineae bacterium]
VVRLDAHAAEHLDGKSEVGGPLDHGACAVVSKAPVSIVRGEKVVRVVGIDAQHAGGPHSGRASPNAWI